MVALADVKGPGVVVTADLGFIVEPDGVDDESVSVPMTDRVTHPRGIGIGGVRAAVNRNDAKRAGIAMQDRDVVGALHDLKLVRNTECLWRGQGHAVGGLAGIIGPAN